MKKHLLFVLVALTILLYACGENQPKQQELSCSPANSEIAIFNHGKLSFYNPQDRCMYYVDNETDSVLTGSYHSDGKFYYCTAVNGLVFLKSIDLSLENPVPVQLADWNLELNDCITETYGEISFLDFFPEQGVFGFWHGFSWDGMDFNECKLYDPKTGTVTDWNHDQVLNSYFSVEEDESHQMAPKFNYDDFTQIGDDYYYKDVCLTDQMDVMSWSHNPDYVTGPEYWGYDVDPSETMVNFFASIEQGDFEHGPICVASLDGKFQKYFEGTDFCRSGSAWLSDGSLVFGGKQPRTQDDPDDDDYWDNSKHCVWIMYPNRQTAVLSLGSFTMKYSK